MFIYLCNISLYVYICICKFRMFLFICRLGFTSALVHVFTYFKFFGRGLRDYHPCFMNETIKHRYGSVETCCLAVLSTNTSHECKIVSSTSYGQPEVNEI